MVVRALQRRRADILDPNRGGAAAVKIQQFGCSHRKVDNSVMRVGPAIVDAHDDGMAVGQIGDARIAWQRHRWVRRRNAVEVKDFTVGSIAAVEVFAIPRGKTDGGIMRIVLRYVHAAADEIGRAHTIGAAALGNWFARIDHPRACGDTILGIDMRAGALGKQKRNHGAGPDWRPSPQLRTTPKLSAGPPPHRPPTLPRQTYQILAWLHCGGNAQRAFHSEQAVAAGIGSPIADQDDVPVRAVLPDQTTAACYS